MSLLAVRGSAARRDGDDDGGRARRTGALLAAAGAGAARGGAAHDGALERAGDGEWRCRSAGEAKLQGYRRGLRSGMPAECGAVDDGGGASADVRPEDERAVFR